MGGDSASEAASRKLMWATGFCFAFMIVEIVGGFMAGSLAIMTDAAHMLSDVGGFCISIFAIWLGRQPATHHMSYGWHRAEILGALMSVMLIWSLTGVLVYEAILRTDKWLAGNAAPVDGLMMSAVAFLALIVNLVLMKILGHNHGGHGHSHGGGGGHGHSHGGGGGGGEEEAHGHGHGGGDDGHGHSHGGGGAKGDEKSRLIAAGADSSSYSSIEAGHGHAHGSIQAAEPAKEPVSDMENINVRAAYIHALGDLIQSVGVLIAGIVIWFRPDLQIADPICTLLFSVLVMWTTFAIVQRSVHVLMEGVPEGIDVQELREGLQGIEGIVDVHDLHVWSLTVGKPALSVHIKAVEPEAALMAAQRYCMSHGISHTTIQVQRDDCDDGDCLHPCLSEACGADGCA